MSSQFFLLKERRFGPFFGTQFLGAFNDNLFKNSLVVLLTFQSAQWSTLKPELLANLAAGIFMLPFFLFSATAGQLADKFDKALLVRLVKVFEIAVMLIAAAGFWMHSLYALLFCLFLLGVHSTLFGPVKYAILPQLLREQELVGGNALIEAGSFIAILLGTLAGGMIAGARGGLVWISGACLLTALGGYLACRGVPSAPAPAPDLKININPISETWRNIGFARENRTVFLSILGISWFWLFGSLLLAQFPAYAKNVLGGTELCVTLLLATFTIGIGLGSLLCERMSAKRVELGLVPFGSIGLTLFGLDLAWASPAAHPAAPLAILPLLASPGTVHVLADLFLIGLFGGFFIVPLYALVQLRSPDAQRARIIAANNIMNALFMVCGAVLAAALLSRGLGIAALFGIAALCNAVVAIYIYGLVPEFLVRFLVWLLLHTIYRLHKRDIEHIPEEGAALIICEPLRFVDVLVITAACRRPIRFVLDPHLSRGLVSSFFFKASGAIAAACAHAGPEREEKTLAEISAALADGDLVCLFPEGWSAAAGELAPLRPGIDRILGRQRVPVIALALSERIGQRVFRHSSGLLGRIWNACALRKISIRAGSPLAAADAVPELLGAELRSLRGEAGASPRAPSA